MGFEDDVFISYPHVDNETLASGSDGNTVKLWDAKSGAEIATLKGTGLMSVRWPSRQTGGCSPAEVENGTVKLWRGATNEEVARQRNK